MHILNTKNGLHVFFWVGNGGTTRDEFNTMVVNGSAYSSEPVKNDQQAERVDANGCKPTVS